MQFNSPVESDMHPLEPSLHGSQLLATLISILKLSVLFSSFTFPLLGEYSCISRDSKDNRSPQTPRNEEIETNLQLAQRNIIAAGNPSVFLRRQLYHICGMSWMHQRTVPMVPRTFDASVILSSEDIVESCV